MTDTQNLDNEPISIWPIIWKYSFIIAAISFGYTFILYLTGLYTNSWLGLITTVIFIILLVIGLKKYRSLNNGYMTFGTATLIGISVSIVSSVIRSVLNFIYLSFIDNSILSTLLDEALTALQQSPGMNDESLEMMMGLYEKIFTPGGLLVMGILTGVIGGVIISLILAAILKKAPPITE